MKHIKLFESFPGSGKVYATCFQGDAYAAVGIIDEYQREELQNAIDSLISEDPYLGEYLKMINLDVTGMSYVLHTADGEFIAMPSRTNTEDYAYYVNENGELGNRGITSFRDEESRLFDLVEGKMISIDSNSNTELLTVNEFIRTYIG